MINLNKIRQLLALIIILAGSSLVVVLFTKTRSSERQPQQVAKLPENVEMSLQKIHLTENRDGVKKWDLTAEKAEYGSNTTRLTGVRLVVPGDKVTGDVTLAAARGVYDMASKDVTLQGAVTAHSTTGMKFTADNATFDAARDLLRSSGHVTFSDPMITVKGEEMEFSTTKRQLRVSRKVTATVVPEAARQ